MQFNRRLFIQTSSAFLTLGPISQPLIVDAKPKPKPKPKLKMKQLKNEVGITVSSMSGHLVKKPTNGKITLLELPNILRNELDIRLIDLNNNAFASYDKKYLDELRTAADKANCLLTNLKMNQHGLDMNSPKVDVRKHAIDIYKKSIDAASHLGIKWARPLPMKPMPDIKIHVASYRELCEYAGERNVTMLVENYGWMQSDSESVVKLIQLIGNNVEACPDIGNWNNNKLRYRGLEKTFPIAVTCDFKARNLSEQGEHQSYDLKRCFEIGWESGFRGPWCLEHSNKNRKQLFKELAWLRDMLRKWTAEKINCNTQHHAQRREKME